MHGVGRASAAVTVVNAIPTGIGCAHGVRLYAAVSVDLEPGPAGRVEVRPESSATPLVLASVHAALARFSPRSTATTFVRVDSEIPRAKGLKSSSAVASATIRAVAGAVGRTVEPADVARMAAGVGREVGVSATGAFDDALAGLLPGFVVTDNRRGELLLHRPSPPDWTAVVHVPPGTHSPSPEFKAAFERAASEGDAVAEAARRGDWTEAMDRNTRLVERVMGYDYRDLRARALREGAVASGVSGLGPALASFVPRRYAAAVLSAMPEERFVVPLTSEEHP